MGEDNYAPVGRVVFLPIDGVAWFVETGFVTSKKDINKMGLQKTDLSCRMEISGVEILKKSQEWAKNYN
jgi:hypothetical protein